MNPSLDTSEAEALPYTPPQTTALDARGQQLVLATLLEKALNVLRNVEAEGSDEDDMLRELIAQGEAAVKTVLLEEVEAAQIDAVAQIVNVEPPIPERYQTNWLGGFQPRAGMLLFTVPQSRKPFTKEQRREIISMAGDSTDGLNQDDFADEIIKLTEAAHNIGAKR